MKKCSRCSAVLKWERSYCPLCGGFTVDAPEAAARPAAAAVQEAVREPEIPAAPLAAEPLHEEPKTQPAAERAVLPPRPVSSVPGLEYLDDEDEPAPRPAAAAPAHAAPAPAAPAAPAAPMQSEEKLTISEDLLGSIGGGASVGGFERFDAPAKIDISGSAQSAGGSFERTGGDSTIPIQQPAAPEGEFLRMFPDAKPE